MDKLDTAIHKGINLGFFIAHRAGRRPKDSVTNNGCIKRFFAIELSIDMMAYLINITHKIPGVLAFRRAAEAFTIRPL